MPFLIHPSLLLFLSVAVLLHKGSTFPNVIFQLQQRENKINTEWSAEGPHFLFPGYKVKLASWWPGPGDLFWSEVNPQINNIGKNYIGGENILDKAAYVCRYIISLCATAKVTENRSQEQAALPPSCEPSFPSAWCQLMQLHRALKDPGKVDREAHTPDLVEEGFVHLFFPPFFQGPRSIPRVILKKQLFPDSQGLAEGSVRKNYPKLEIGKRDYWVFLQCKAGLALLIAPVGTEVNFHIFVRYKCK